MDLFFYRGLNCHNASVLNIAAALGVDYKKAFATLWSETDFTEHPKFKICLSERLIPNLEALGVGTEVLSCESNEQSAQAYNGIREGEFFLVGMDTFHIPWSLFYQHFYEPHYFFAQKKPKGFVSCFDPTYNKANIYLEANLLAPYAFELGHVYYIPPANPHSFDLCREAREILHKHPVTLKKWCAEIYEIKNKERKNCAPLVKQITAMINNRYLFKLYLDKLLKDSKLERQFFDKNFLLKWEAIKNGLYKVSVIKDNEATVEELCRLFTDVITEEIEMAEILCSLEPVL